MDQLRDTPYGHWPNTDLAYECIKRSKFTSVLVDSDELPPSPADQAFFRECAHRIYAYEKLQQNWDWLLIAGIAGGLLVVLVLYICTHWHEGCP